MEGQLPHCRRRYPLPNSPSFAPLMNVHHSPGAFELAERFGRADVCALSRTLPRRGACGARVGRIHPQIETQGGKGECGGRCALANGTASRNR